MPLIVLLAALGAFTAAEAPPPTAAAASTPAAPAAAQAPIEKKICHLEDSTGSNFPKRVCRTERQWSTMEAGASGDASMKQRGGVRPGDR